MNKDELLKKVRSERNIILTALHFSYIVSWGNWQDKFKQYCISDGIMDLELASSKITINIGIPSKLIELYNNPKTLHDSCFNLVRLSIRSALNQYYESIQSFCKGNSLNKQKWENASWRPLARIARNSFSHDFRLNFRKDKNNLRDDVNYTFPNGRVISISNNLHGQEINGDNLPIDAIMELFIVMEDFIDNELQDPV